jgi:hypothetical protein
MRCDFDRLPRTRFGAVAVRDIGRHLWISGTHGRTYFVKTVELIAKWKDAETACFDQITTALEQASDHSRKTDDRIAFY